MPRHRPGSLGLLLRYLLGRVGLGAPTYTAFPDADRSVQVGQASATLDDERVVEVVLDAHNASDQVPQKQSILLADERTYSSEGT